MNYRNIILSSFQPRLNKSGTDIQKRIASLLVRIEFATECHVSSIFVWDNDLAINCSYDLHIYQYCIN